MDKNTADVEIAKAKHAGDKVADLFKTIRYIVAAGAAVAIAYFLITGLEAISTKARPEAINAVAKLAESLRLDYWILWLVIGASGTAAAIYRLANRRSIKKIDELRKKLERSDPDRSSSGLDKDGETPE